MVTQKRGPVQTKNRSVKRGSYKKLWINAAHRYWNGHSRISLLKGGSQQNALLQNESLLKQI